MTVKALSDRLAAGTEPKRVLALDGGGVRGVLSLEILRAIEKTLRERRGNPGYVLADYFDLIGGTSTGAIIAAALALGFSVDKIASLYFDLAAKIFRKPWFRIGAFVPKFGAGALKDALQEFYGKDTTLGSDRLATGLMIMTKRMDTGSPWPITNNPADPYYLPVPGKKRIGHANMLLWQLVRASTAAPHYFRPEDLAIGRWTDASTGDTNVERGQFVDGGVSTANNPSFQLLKVVLIDGFRFRWTAGEDRLLMVSVGTGLADRRHGHARGISASAGAFAFRALLSIMDDCNDDVELLMQWLSNSPTARAINGQLGTLAGNQLATRPLLSYLRYNAILKEEWMREHLGVTMAQSALNDLSEMDRPRNMKALRDLGARAAALVLPTHLPAAFDPA